MMSDTQRLAGIRAAHAAIAPARWTRLYGGARQVEAESAIGAPAVILTAAPAASEDEFAFAADAPEHVGFLLALIDRAIERLRGAPGAATGAGGAGENRKDYAAEAAMKCAEPAFRVFLESCHGLERPLTDERVAQKLRSILGVTSRADLNRDAASAARWQDLRRAFDAWRRAGR